MDRLVTWIKDYAREVNNSFNERLVPSKTVTQSGSTSLVFGESTQVAPQEGDTVNASLPRVKTTDAGKRCAIIRRTETGTVNVTAPGTFVNTLASQRLLQVAGIVVFISDGVEYWTQYPGA